ncbi:hypothetical protein [Luteococcus sp.]|jgi:hypothetical protein|uniref:hypothetical protein n=1 Tax=Luteococcus sp. TaxID=1969402 RepID=UPI0037360B96
MTTRHASRRKPRKKPTEATTIDWSAAQKRAETAMRRSKATIEAGESFAAQKPAERSGAPSKYRGGRAS